MPRDLIFGRPRITRPDFTASLVVFLVALPLCIGVAVASGVPAELGLVTGIVGGLVVGALPGSRLQVSGPAAGLTVLVYEAVRAYGLATLGVIVLVAGVLQILMGAGGIGAWFRAISSSVVQGMLAGIGLVLMASQTYALLGAAPRGDAAANLAGLPGLVGDVAGDRRALTACALGAGVIVTLLLWPRLPRRIRTIPAPLAAVGLATAAAALLDAPVSHVHVEGLFNAIQPPDTNAFSRVAEVEVLGTAAAFALIASAESLFSAAAVDRMHKGARTKYDKELMAQGVGNVCCGILGALPMTAVVVRSAANVQAGARTKASRILHGLWLLLFAALVPSALGAIPLAALAGVLVHAGWKLLAPAECLRWWRRDRAEAGVLVATAGAIVVTNLLEGVVLGLLLAVAKSAWETSAVRIDVIETEHDIRVRMVGNATFLRLPRILATLEALPQDRAIHLDVSELRHLDHACHAALVSWADTHGGSASRVNSPLHRAGTSRNG
ncbi:SulP family inorganic anion transporter [Embleya sp. NBC_00896]|uniref:SulP family inorganic anion transporter n=1 Tax=Embleya sp. NBC_00896 TaxID=2975961 RepID=UPI002F914CEB|nr:SulP family inorganic anion transporter [Embleya sp. NBC_00896]